MGKNNSPDFDTPVTDVKTKKFIEWNTYKDKTPEEALAAIYGYINTEAQSITSWYWTNIRTKRTTSLTARGIAFTLLLVGSALQIYATTLDTAGEKLCYTQIALAAIAIAALAQLGDKAFGWSTGWMRYITTATTMENLCRAFQLEWAKYLVSRTAPLNASDTKALFDLAEKLEQELLKLQGDETTKWVTEFNAGISILDSAIKTQREETEKKVDAIRTTLATQDTAAKVDEKANAPGSLEVTVTHKAELKKIDISLDSEIPVEFMGSSWSKLGIPPGQHKIRVKILVDPPHIIEKVIEIQASAVTRTEIRLPA